MSSEFEPLDSHVEWTGKVIRAGTARFRHADGAEVTRDKVWHPGAVGILAVDEESVWLTRQPREVPGMPDSLEIPAGKLDVPGEAPLATGQRELAEEVGCRAARWTELMAFYSSPGFADERVWLFLAQDLSDAGHAEAEEDERIEIVQWPLARLDEAIKQSQDAKSLIALLWLKSSGSPR
jgi:8-oxo-dGTP pyrophosphatase MutT (NUDIX family)